MAKKKETKKNRGPTKAKVQSSLKNSTKETTKKITVKDLDDETLSELEPVILDVGRRYKVAEYIAFVQWTSLPTFEREPETQGLFAKKHGVHEVVLSRWKNSPEFWEDVSRIRRAYMQDDFGDIIKALKKNIIQNGRGQDVKVYGQLAGVLKEDGDGTLKLNPTLENAIKKIGGILPD